jgi:hypothetical protein
MSFGKLGPLWFEIIPSECQNITKKWALESMRSYSLRFLLSEAKALYGILRGLRNA